MLFIILEHVSIFLLEPPIKKITNMKTIEISSFEQFEIEYRDFFVKNKKKIQKNYQIVDIKKIQQCASTKKCFIFVSETTFVFAFPIFDFLELILFYTDESKFENDLSFIKEYVKKNQPHVNKLKVSLCDNSGFESVRINDILLANGFYVSKKIARFKNSATRNNKSNLDSDYMLTLVPEHLRHAEFAKKEDAKEILECMLKEFDPIGDAIPELYEIEDNIEKGQVVIVRDYSVTHPLGKIVSFTYFNIINSIYYGLFDYSDRNYRQYFVFYAVQYFMDHIKRDKKISRRYGWRDINNKRTTRYALNKKDEADGVVVCNLSCEL